MLKQLITILAFLLVSGCGTIKTAAPDNNQVDIAYGGLSINSHCDSIPRVYSGVSYHFCFLHGERQPEPSDGMTFRPGLSVILVDSVFSAVADTVLLPYTFYGQITEGPIRVN